MSESEVSPVSFKPKYIVCWAKLAGFPFWPARLCTSQEIVSMQSLKSPKFPQVAVSFLGIQCQKGWVTHNAVCDFTFESLKDKLNKDKFRREKDYIAAIVESVRIVMTFGVTFPIEFMTSIAVHQKDFPLEVSEFCQKCKGTSYSGHMMQCEECLTNECHLHCYEWQYGQKKEGKWFCDKCCKTKGIKNGTIIPFEITEETSHAESPLELTNSAKKSRNVSRGNLEKSLNESDNTQRGSAVKRKRSDQSSNRNSLQTISGTSTSSVGDVESDVDSVIEAAVEEEICFVCGLGGKVLLCDFPNCSKVYHQMCIIKSAHDSNLALNTELNMDDVWFCPRHNCVSCGVLESGAYQPLTNIPQRQLKSCQKCPFSMCIDCDINVSEVFSGQYASETNSSCDVNGGCCQSFLQSKRYGDDLECLNCISSEPTLRLAQLLERAWSKMTGSRLSIPFLRPLLPVVAEQHPMSVDMVCDEENEMVCEESLMLTQASSIELPKHRNNAHINTTNAITTAGVRESYRNKMSSTSLSSSSVDLNSNSNSNVSSNLKGVHTPLWPEVTQSQSLNSLQTATKTAKQHQNLVYSDNDNDDDNNYFPTNSHTSLHSPLLSNHSACSDIHDSNSISEYFFDCTQSKHNNVLVANNSKQPIARTQSGHMIVTNDSNNNSNKSTSSINSKTSSVAKSNKNKTNKHDSVHDDDNDTMTFSNTSIIFSSDSVTDNNSHTTNHVNNDKNSSVNDGIANMQAEAAVASTVPIVTTREGTFKHTNGEKYTVQVCYSNQYTGGDVGDAKYVYTTAIKDAVNAVADKSNKSNMKSNRNNKNKSKSNDNSTRNNNSVDTETELEQLQSTDITTNSHFTPHDLDLLHILEKIRALKYTSCREYNSDLNVIRNNVIKRLHDLLMRGDTAAIEQDARYKCILGSYDTLLDASYSYLHSKDLLIRTLESSINSNTSTTTSTGMHSTDSGLLGDEVNGLSLGDSKSDKRARYSHSSGGTTTTGPVVGSRKSIRVVQSEATSGTTTGTAAGIDQQPAATTTSSGTKMTTTTKQKPKQKPTLIYIDPSLSAEKNMLSLWRRECDVYIAPDAYTYKSISSAYHHIKSKPDLNITARSLSSWVEYLDQGEFSFDFRGHFEANPYSVCGQIADNERVCDVNTVAKSNVRNLLSENTIFSDYLNNELNAANLMSGMKSSNQRETVTLLEGARSVTDKHQQQLYHQNKQQQQLQSGGGFRTNNAYSGDPVYGEYGLSPDQDETLIVLNRLQEVTKQAMQLETRLRADYLHKQRSVLTADHEVLTIGQVGVLRELKLANDNLRWRLQQKSNVLASNKSIIERLQSGLRDSERNLESVTDERNRLREELARMNEKVGNGTNPTSTSSSKSKQWMEGSPSF